MPVCCTPTIIQFANETQTIINYTQEMRDKYAFPPKVYVYYFDPVSLEYVLSVLPLTSMRWNGDTLTIDHGGPQSGRVVIT
jgi:hypothetical protein